MESVVELLLVLGVLGLVLGQLWGLAEIKKSIDRIADALENKDRDKDKEE